MSLTFFIIDENGTFPSTDNTKRYRCLSGEQLYLYLNSPEGKCKRFYIDYETGVGVEIPDELVFSFREEDRHRQYLSDMKKKYDYKLISLSEPATNTGISGEEVIPDMSTSVPEEAERSILLQELRKAIHKLTAEELRIINYLYLSDNCCTQEQLAQLLGISQQAVSKRCKTILNKLKKHFSI